MKLHLQSTDYGKLLSSSEEDLTVSLVDCKLRENLVTEFRCLRSNALPPLSTFLDYITYATTRHRMSTLLISCSYLSVQHFVLIISKRKLWLLFSQFFGIAFA